MALGCLASAGQVLERKGKEAGNARVDKNGELTDHKSVCEEELTVTDFVKRFDLVRYHQLEQTIQKWHLPLYFAMQEQWPLVCVTKQDINQILNLPPQEGRIAGWLPGVQNRRDYIFIQQSVLEPSSQVSKKTLGEVLMRERLQNYVMVEGFAQRDLILSKVMKAIFETENQTSGIETIPKFNDLLRELQFATSESLPRDVWEYVLAPKEMNQLISFVKNGGRVNLTGLVFESTMMSAFDVQPNFESLLVALKASGQVIQMSERDTWKQIDTFVSVLSFDPVDRPSFIVPYPKGNGPIPNDAKIAKTKEVIDLFVRYPEVIRLKFRHTSKSGIVDLRNRDLNEVADRINYISMNLGQDDLYAFFNWGVFRVMDLGLLPKTAILHAHFEDYEANVCQMLFVYNSVHTSQKRRDRNYLKELFNRCDSKLMIQ